MFSLCITYSLQHDCKHSSQGTKFTKVDGSIFALIECIEYCLFGFLQLNTNTGSCSGFLVYVMTKSMFISGNFGPFYQYF